MPRVTKISFRGTGIALKKINRIQTVIAPTARDGEQEVKRSAHEAQGGVKRQGTPISDTDCQQRRRSWSAGSSKEKKEEELEVAPSPLSPS